jgi:hypothetical protein
MRIDPDCPSDSNSPIVTTLQILAAVYFLLSVAGSGAVFWSGRQNTEQMEQVMADIAVSGIDLGGSLPAEAMQTASWMWTGSAIAILFQGIAMSAILFALASVTGSLIGIRMSSRATAQSALDARSVRNAP